MKILKRLTYSTCLISLITSLWTIQSIAEGQWHQRGVGGGGGLYVPSISPYNDDMFMSTDMSAVYRSTDIGKTWQMIPFRELTGSSQSKVIFTSNPKVLYALNEGRDAQPPFYAVKKSVDGGNTWSPIDVVRDDDYERAFNIFASPYDENILVVITRKNILLTTNGGKNFRPIASWILKANEAVAGVFWQKDWLYLASGNQLYQLNLKKNSGKLQPFQFKGMPFDQHFSQLSGNNQGTKGFLYAVAVKAGEAKLEVPPGERWRNAKGVYQLVFDPSIPLHKQNTQWQEIFLDKTEKTFITLIALPQNKPSVAFLAGTDRKFGYPVVYKSIDEGKTWSSILNARYNENVATGWAGHDGDTDWWYGSIAEGLSTSSDGTKAIVTDMGFVHVTDNGGKTWRQSYVSKKDQNPAKSFTPRGKFYQSNGVEQTSSWWIQWASKNDVFVSMTDITSQFSNDGGLSWTRNRNNGLTSNTTYQTVQHPKTGHLYGAIASVHDLYQTVYLRSSLIDKGEGGIAISKDNGNSWSVLYDLKHPVTWLAFDPNDANTLYASVVDSKEGGIYVTHDLHLGSAAQWKKLSAPPRTVGHPYTLNVLKDGGLVVSYAGVMEENWSFQRTAAGIFYSKDKGKTWEDVSVPEMTYWMKDVVVDPNDSQQNTWYGAVFSAWGTPIHKAGGLYRTKNRGKSWKRIANLYRVESCTVSPTNPNHMYVTTENSGLWQTFNLNDENPKFEPVEEYPFKHPLRVLFNPHHPEETWVTSFGGGLFVLNPTKQ